MEVEIIKLDHNGRGIGYLNNKIIFIENALIGEKIDVEVIKETSKYLEGRVKKYITESSKRTKSKCPFYENCGGCHLRHISYKDTLNFKKNKVKEILLKYANIEPKIEVIKCENRDFYRNKIEVKIKDGVCGFYKKSSHDLVEIDRCLNAEEAINSFLLNISALHLNNGDVTIKSNYNGEILIVIDTNEEPNIDIESLRSKNKLVGIVVNDKLIYGSDHFIEIIANMFFKESYNSFFQVNRDINSKLFKLVTDGIKEGSTVLDLCSGVGTLSIAASEKAKKVYAIEIVENAVIDALLNARMNKRDNINFMLGDAFKSISKIEDKIDTIIIDPPRRGLTEEALNSILNCKPNDIIYISCNPITLSRDLKVLLNDYDVKKFYILDMFPYTYHCESVCILERR